MFLVACTAEYPVTPGKDTAPSEDVATGDTATGDTVDDLEPEEGMGEVVLHTTLGSRVLDGMAVSAYAVGEDGGVTYLGSGWSEEEFEVESGTVRLAIGDPAVHETTEDGYPTARWGDQTYVGAPVDATLPSGGRVEETIAVSLLIGEKYYEVVEADCWELEDGREHEVEYAKGEEWQEGWVEYNPWLYQRQTKYLALEDDDLTEVPFGFLNPGEWLEVKDDGVALMPESTTNIMRDMRASHDDFSFVYIDLVRECWWEVSARAW
ncbi:hypothetical protein HYS28_03645 [Candidatus Uhrbacteria bacterium]|nr:hypothetical protein [Candidatus Uhrbacteria bacterium]